MKWLRDPLWWFLLAGLAMYAITWVTDDGGISYDIEVGENDLDRLVQQWQAQMRRPPSSRELEGLLSQFVREEIYYREAKRLGLESNDTIVRRRLVQKLTFLTEDVATATPATEAELQTFYQANQENYRVPERFSFSHKYFSSDRHTDAQARAAAATVDPSLSDDPFMLQKQYQLRSAREIGDLFGREFANALTALTADGQWQGPIQSAYGWHPVRLDSISPSRIPAFAEVQERVAADARQQQRQTANNAYYEELLAQYNITYPQGLTAP